jgi:hypothetical protein
MRERRKSGSVRGGGEQSPSLLDHPAFASADRGDHVSAGRRGQAGGGSSSAVRSGSSPVGAAGWILEKFGKWADLPTTTDGSPDIWSKFSEEQLLINIMLYVAPSSVVTATSIYHGKRLEGSQTFASGTRVRVPAGVAAFPDPVFLPPPRSFAEKTYNIVHWSEMPSGGHFAALEPPDLMLADLRAFVSTVSGEQH